MTNRADIPAGFDLTEITPHTWRLTLPNEWGTALEGPNPVTLRRAAWAIHDLEATGYLAFTAVEIALHLEGDEPE